MGEHHCENCDCEFDVDILNEEYHLYQVVHCPSCGAPLEREVEYD